MGSHDGSPLNLKNLPLSLSQNEVWLDQRAWPESSHLNIGGAGFLAGPLNRDRFREAFEILVAETEALRLAPLSDGGQSLLVDADPVLEIVDMRNQADPASAMRAWWQASMAVPFALDGSPPWRFTLLLGSDELHGVAIQFHHLIMDGWGTSLLLQRWSEIYNALAVGLEPPEINRGSYLDFIEESNAYRESASFKRDEDYWLEQVPALPEKLFDRLTDAGDLHGLAAAQLATYRIPRPEYDALLRNAAEMGYTSFVLFLAALAIYLTRINHRGEVVIGVPSLNRGKRYRGTPGMFAGVFPLRVVVPRDAPLAELLASINGSLRGALRHASYPLSELGRKLQVIRHGRDGIFDVLLSFERQDYGLNFGAASSVDSRQLFSGISRYPLGISICEFNQEEDVEIALEGSTSYFSAGDMTLLSRRLWHLVTAIVTRREATVSDIDILPPEELWAVVDGFHHDVAHNNSALPFIALFEHQAALRPDGTALVWDYGTMDYATLDRRANALAHRLSAIGIRTETIVAIAIPRSADMIVGMLAIAKAGAAFLPLDLDAPTERIDDILEQSGAAAVLIQEEHWDRFSSLRIPRLVTDRGAELSGDARLGPPAKPAVEDLAYVLFTSGSTGRPKGVAVDHGTLARRLGWLSKAYGVDWRDRTAQATQLTFDPALIECLLPLTHGASIALPPPGRLHPSSLATFAVSKGVTIMAFVPTTLTSFLDGMGGRAGLRLRVACCGGEVLSAELANRFLAETGARLYNVYGPTETAIFATAWECEPRATDTALPIGRPIDDTRIYVLDQAMRPLPIGQSGEVFIGGQTLARGYLNRTDLTNAAFLSDPFVPQGRIYRTGDRGWIGNDGNLHFSGRLDRQVKLRGYRIELGEIETALLRIAAVGQAAAKLVSESNKPVIHAWISATTSISQEVLHQSLRARLPDYMLPGRIDILATLPSTGSGKIDYGALIPSPAVNSPQPPRPPTSTLERDLLRLWEDSLGKRPLGIRDDFFDLGGDSLSAVGIIAGIDRLLGRKVSLYALTEHPTVEKLAIALSKDLSAPRLMVRLGSGEGTRIPIYLAASGHGDLLRFQSLATALGQDYPLYMLQPPAGAAIPSIKELAHLYTDRIQAHGDRHAYVAGFSVGGVSALETACQLHQRGIKVYGLILIDTVYPRQMIGGKHFWSALRWLSRHLHLQELSMNGRRLEAMFSDPGLTAQISALNGYTPTAFDGPTLLIKSTGLASWDRLLFRPWRKLFGKQLSEENIPGLHGSVFESSCVDNLSRTLKTRLAQDDPVPALAAPGSELRSTDGK